MNWYKQSSGSQRIDDIPSHIFSAIRSTNEGFWEVHTAKKLIPSFRLQYYSSTEIYGQNVKMQGDKFYVKVFSEIKKKPEDIEYPPGYFADDNPPGGKWWGPSNSPERIQKERDYGQPFNQVAYYDPATGHELLFFRGLIEGWKPGMMPDKEIDYQQSAGIKGYPIPVSSPGEFRFETERIDGFEELRTPYEVAQFVQKSINDFYGGGRGGYDPEDPPSPPAPSESTVPVGIVS